jgi:hypothetical protein
MQLARRTNMIISDLSYLEVSAASNIEGGDNYASVYQSAYSAAGNNSGKFNVSVGNSATSVNIADISQYDNDYYSSYYRYYPYYW